MSRVTLPTYIGYCCREWILAITARTGRCGYCGQVPVYHREDPESVHP